MKKNLSIILVIIGALFIIIMLLSSRYNSLVSLDEQVKSAWSQVENVYQRRADLIENLVNTVKGYASHEKETFKEVIEARSKATSFNVDPNNLNEVDIENFQNMQQNLSGALSRLMVVVEKYPDLKANQNFLDLQAQLEGTENRIAVERRNFIETAQGYNKSVRQFPNNIIAGLFGFKQKAYFKSEQGANQAPKVDFNK